MAGDRRLLYLLQRATRAAVGRVNAATIGSLGVSAAQLGTLSHLARRPGSTMTEVAALFDLNKSAMSGMIARLERDRLVRREPNPSDGRGALLFLTGEGESVRKKAGPIFRRAMGEMTEGFKESELDVVFRFLNRLVEGFAEGESE